MEGNAGNRNTDQTGCDLPKPQSIEAGWIADHIISLFVRAYDYGKIHSEAAAAILRYGQEEFQRGMQYQSYLNNLDEKLAAAEVSNKITETLTPTPPPLPVMELSKVSDSVNESLKLKAVP